MSQALYSAAQVRELDRLAIEEHGIPGLTLMERAGNACFATLRERWPDARNMTVLCGLGNNAGDGYVIARLAHEQKIKVSVLQLGDAAKLQGDAASAHAAMQSAGLTTSEYQGRLPSADVYIDALFGTGLDREVAGDWRSIIEQLNAIDTPCLAVDIPSGLHADTGNVLGAAVHADCTVTFIGRKRGMSTGAAADHCGHITFNDLEVPAAIYSGIDSATRLIAWNDFSKQLRPRPRTAHKGHFGHVL
ncbi:MAG: NAD(P)H-hydrate epimerase, partial [Thiotrichales bacterium]|nr:NAD(P)H-hydrate epimerase [Thiotrichales bacterium]